VASNSSEHEEPARTAAQFATTRWSVVLVAGEGDSTQSQLALEELCRSYWYPLYAYVRRRGSTQHDAEDLVQGFFAQILRHQSLSRVSPEKGRFRSFLIASFDYYLADDFARKTAAKRGGGQTTISFDAVDAEKRFALEPAERLTPLDLFERRWALTLLEQVLRQLELVHQETGKQEFFSATKHLLHGDRSSHTYAEIASRIGMTEGALKVSVSRMRRRFRELLVEAVRDTVGTPGDLQPELRHLLRAVRR